MTERGREMRNVTMERDDWLVAVEAQVVDVNDPEGMHRVKVVIPSMDENFVHDEWVTALVPWVGAAGYGPVHLPAVGTEVLLFGRLGQKFSLFYLSRFNEDFQVPGEFATGERGLKTDGAYKLIAELLVVVLSMQQVDVNAPIVRLLGSGSEGVRVEPGKVSVLGAQPAARQTLPPDATDLSSCVTLCNALKHLVAIKFGFAQ